MGLGTFSELRVALLGALLAAAVGAFAWTHHEGYEACRAPQKAAEKAQVEKDLADAKGTIHDLQAQLAAIPPAKPAPVLRLCPSRSVRAEGPSSGAQPAVAQPAGTGSPGVSGGDGASDFGPAMQDSERAAEVIAIFRDTTWQWAVKQAQP